MSRSLFTHMSVNYSWNDMTRVWHCTSVRLCTGCNSVSCSWSYAWLTTDVQWDKCDPSLQLERFVQTVKYWLSRIVKMINCSPSKRQNVKQCHPTVWPVWFIEVVKTCARTDCKRRVVKQKRINHPRSQELYPTVLERFQIYPSFSTSPKQLKTAQKCLLLQFHSVCSVCSFIKNTFVYKSY